ncbi:radical SAM protein [Methanococcoides sp. SA1]|nr:radical SAM protein [Methanococcoides sp. SA1]
MKTKTDSYKLNNLCRGCQFCLRGQKLVLFVGGKCSRNCWYCSLSEGRKNSPQMWANERPCNSAKDIIEEAIESNAKGAGITGGDPLVYFKETLRAAKALKEKFGKKFHIHIYLPFPLVNKERLIALEKYIDEVRFHASFLIDETKTEKELEKLKLASEIFGKHNTGIELPLLPNKKKEIIQYIKSAQPYISFCNLNEFELSDTNFNIIEKSYTLNEDTYTISRSIETGKQILKHFSRAKSQQLKAKGCESLAIHLCTAKTKNHHQYHNRLIRHNILPYGTKTEEATVIYIEIPNPTKETIQSLKKHTKKFHIDKKNNRILLDQSQAKNLLGKFDLHLSEEHPTFDAEKMSYWKLTKEDFS